MRYNGPGMLVRELCDSEVLSVSILYTERALKLDQGLSTWNPILGKECLGSCGTRYHELQVVSIVFWMQ